MVPSLSLPSTGVRRVDRSPAVRGPAARLRLHARWRVTTRGAVGSASVFVRDVCSGLIEVSHSLLAMVGLAFAVAIAFALMQRDLRHGVEAWTLGWLQARQEARQEPQPHLAAVVAVVRQPDPAKELAEALKEPDASARATASDLTQLNRQQASVAQWLARRYHVAPEPVGRLVQEAWSVGQKAGLEPTLILAIMAVESSFNPFAQSAVGAQGLMQVMTKVHNEKYEAFGGNRAAFDPVTNLRVGVQVLKECIVRAGSIPGGLRSYVGSNPQGDDGGYAVKVLSEQSTLKLVASGKSVSPQQRTLAFTPAPKPEPREPAPKPAPSEPPAVPDEVASLS